MKRSPSFYAARMWAPLLVSWLVATSFAEPFDAELSVSGQQSNKIELLRPRTSPLLDSLYSGRQQSPRLGPPAYRAEEVQRFDPFLIRRSLIDHGYGMAGKLPILPEKPRSDITDAAGNVLPSVDYRRNLYSPLRINPSSRQGIGLPRRLSATERTQQQLYRGPSHPGMIAPRAQQQRRGISARDLGN